MFGRSDYDTPSNNIQTETGVVANDDNYIKGLVFDHEIKIENADFFRIDSYKDGYYMIKSNKDDRVNRMLVVPENGSVPEDLDKNIIVVKQPVNNSKIDSITMVDLLGQIKQELLDKVSLITLEKEKIYIERVVKNMDEKTTRFSGSSTEPDFKFLKEVKPQVYLCNSDLEKSEIYRKIQKLDISPFVTYLHSETSLLGRIEWIKALGVIYGDLESAVKFYDEQKETITSVDKSLAGNKTFAMMCLRKKDNKVFVKRTDDVIPKIGELAGGKNMLSDVHKVSLEEYSIDDFVSKYNDTDFLIYLDGHGDKVTSINDLAAISDKLVELKAVKEGNVWRTRTDYLQMNNIGDMTKELNFIFSSDEDDIRNIKEFVKVE